MIIDFEKAFDSINWNFLLKSLEAYNFGENFLKQIKCIYNDVKSIITNNGYLSDWFELKRTCPLSPYLFIIATELLAINIRNDNKIEGIKLGDKVYKLNQLADDTICFTTNLKSVNHTLTTFDRFYSCAGLELNKDKTSTICIGTLSRKKFT
jgi:hypothetical protein